MDRSVALSQVPRGPVGADREDLTDDAECDLMGRPAAEIEADRRVQPVQFHLRERPALGLVAVEHLLEPFARTQEADIWDRRDEEFLVVDVDGWARVGGSGVGGRCVLRQMGRRRGFGPPRRVGLLSKVIGMLVFEPDVAGFTRRADPGAVIAVECEESYRLVRFDVAVTFATAGGGAPAGTWTPLSEGLVSVSASRRSAMAAAQSGSVRVASATDAAFEYMRNVVWVPFRSWGASRPTGPASGVSRGIERDGVEGIDRCIASHSCRRVRIFANAVIGPDSWVNLAQDPHWPEEGRVKTPVGSDGGGGHQSFARSAAAPPVGGRVSGSSGRYRSPIVDMYVTLLSSEGMSEFGDETVLCDVFAVAFGLLIGI